MAIVCRRGAYQYLDKNKLLPGEWAIVTSGDPDSTNGFGAYMCFGAGVVERFVTKPEIDQMVRNSATNVIDTQLGGIATRMDSVENNTDNLQLTVNQIDATLTETKTSVEGFETRISTLETTSVDLSPIQNQITDTTTSLYSLIFAPVCSLGQAETVISELGW